MDIPAFLSAWLQIITDSVTRCFSGMTPDDVTNLFIRLIVSVFLFLGCILVVNAARGRAQLSLLKKKVGNLALNGHIPADKRSIFEELSKPQTKLFSACLQEYGGVLYATQDVESLSYSLWEPPLLRSRLMPAGAALLTGLGVLGTFAGLLLGLGGLHLDGSMEQLQAEIRQVAQGPPLPLKHRSGGWP